MEQRKQFKVAEELLASHTQRFTNLLIDTVMQLVMFFGVLVFIVAIAEINKNKDFVNGLPTNTLAQFTLTSCISLVYYNFFEIFWAQTVGKMITQTIVVDENGDKPNHEIILVRSLCRLIPFNALSFLFMSRGWHDRISKTYVVNKRMLDEKKRLFYALNQTGNN